MAKKISIMMLLGLMLFVSACSGSGATTSPSTTTVSSQGSDLEANALIVGTMKLADTDQAVTAEQAADLLVLWKAMQALSTSDMTAQVELDALLVQIEETMTTGQVAAIKAMNITDDTLVDEIAALGIQGGGGAGGANLSEDQRATLEAQMALGQMPEGMQPPSGEMPSGDAAAGGGRQSGSSGGMAAGGGIPAGAGGGMPAGGGSMLSTGGGDMPADAAGLTGQTTETTPGAQVERASLGINNFVLSALIQKLNEWAG